MGRALRLSGLLSVFVRSNPVVSDPRVDKEVQSLLSYGLNVIVLGWDRVGKYKHSEYSGHKQVFRFGVKAPYNSPILVFYYPLFWFWVLLKLLHYRPSVVHFCDLDSALPGILFRLLIPETKLIFDVFDTYTLLVEYRSKLAAKFIRIFERRVAALSDGFITVSENRLDFFEGVNLKVMRIVMNCPPVDGRTSGFVRKRQKNGVFKIIYAGTVASHRGLFEVAEAIRGLGGVEFLIAGRIVDKDIAEGLKGYANVRYVGELSFSQSLEFQRDADVIPLLYDYRQPINRVASPNKLYEAMMLGVPVITTLSGPLFKVPFGVQVEYGDVVGIRKAIAFLKECPEERAKLGLLGRFAYEREYNWSVMERRLFDLYDRVLSSGYAN